jgi:phosphate-selective porin
MSFAAWFGAGCLLLGLQSAPPPAPSPGSSAGTPVVSPADTTAKSAPSDPTPIRVGPILLTGYAQADGLFPLGEHEASQNGTFRIRRARVYASGDVLPKIGFMISADVSGSPALLDVYLAVRHFAAANVRVGQFIAPYSLERLTSSKDLEAIDRVVDHLVPGRDMGVMVFNSTPFWGRLSYSAAVINGTGQNTRDNNDAKDYVGRLVFRVPRLTGFSVGANAASGRQPAGMRNRWGADANFDRGDYRLAAEYVHLTREDRGGRPSHGFYVLARRRFRPATVRSDFYMAEAVLRIVDIRDPAEITVGVPGVHRREVQAGGNYYFARNVRVMADAFVPIDRTAGVPRATIVTRVQFIF